MLHPEVGQLTGLVLFRGLSFGQVFPGHIDPGKPGELQNRAGGPEERLPGGNIHGGLVDFGRLHLAGDEAVPDQTIQRQQVLFQIGGDPVRTQLQGSGTDGFVGILGPFFIGIT